uniref:Regenerating islet-derived protein 4-like n=1 Tax=Geotrypetes seraphini TaxID=260995 RepID=A0A6P8QPV3_GEOSA|nr:regenerating islet-derived protein 4-like [Geotrypetes seraphini]
MATADREKTSLILLSGIFSMLLLTCITLSEPFANEFFLFSEYSAKHICPSTWFYYRSNCYNLILMRKEWSDAESYCKNLGSGTNLASIHGKSEASIIGSYISALEMDEPVWIGLHKSGETWEWTDGTIYKYKAWYANESEPSENTGNCVDLLPIQYFITWESSTCKLAKHFICKWRLPAKTKET